MNWLWAISEKEMGPRAGMRWEPHWNMRPAFQKVKTATTMPAAAKRGEILAEGFDRENREDHAVGVVNIEHEAGDRGENQPLREGARGARLVPIPEEDGHGEGGMRMGPRGIEIHVDG